MTNNLKDFLQTIDWRKLSDQKKSLKIFINTLDDSNFEIVRKHMPKVKFPKKENHLKNLNKLLKLIDLLQDEALNQGIKMNEVFPISEKVSLILNAKKNKN